MYSVTPVLIDSNHPLFTFCDKVSHLANNMYNAAVFCQRQCISGLPKDVNKRFPLESEVINSFSANIKAMNEPRVKQDGTPKKTRSSKPGSGPSFQMPTAERPWLSYGLLNRYFQVTENKDYRAEALGSQSCQNVIKEATQQFKNYRNALKEYNEDPSQFIGKPNLPGYLTPGGTHTLTLSNVECDIRTGAEIRNDNLRREKRNQDLYISGLTKKVDGKSIEYLPEDHAFLKLPKTNLICDLGPAKRLNLTNQRLMEVKITPHHGVFTISVTLGSDMDKKTFEKQKKEREERKQKRDAKKTKKIPELLEGTPLRAVSLDLGVDNLAAVTNNIGAECLLFKGLGIKSVNQYYNKCVAKIMSEQTTGTTNKFVPTPEFLKLTLRRNNQISDFMHKTAKTLISWCRDHKINTIVIGRNKFWKQNADMAANVWRTPRSCATNGRIR